MKLKDIPAPVYYIGAGVVVVLLVRHFLPQLAQAINPLNDNNIFARGTNAVGAALSGDESFSLGGSIFSATHADPFNAPASFNAESFARHQRLTDGKG